MFPLVPTVVTTVQHNADAAVGVFLFKLGTCLFKIRYAFRFIAVTTSLLLDPVINPTGTPSPGGQEGGWQLCQSCFELKENSGIFQLEPYFLVFHTHTKTSVHLLLSVIENDCSMAFSLTRLYNAPVTKLKVFLRVSNTI